MHHFFFYKMAEADLVHWLNYKLLNRDITSEIKFEKGWFGGGDDDDYYYY